MFVVVVMVFVLKMGPATFQRIIAEIFDDYILAFMQVFLDNFIINGQQIKHLKHLCLCLKLCRNARLSLNPAKCVFHVTSSALLGHMASCNGIAMDPNKVHTIMHAPALTI